MEHVLLRPDVTPSEVDDACASAVESGLAAVMVWPADVPRAVAASGGSRVTVVAAVGHPDRTPGAPLDQARQAIQAGARHLAVALDPRTAFGDSAADMAGQLRALCRMAHAEGVHVRAVLHPLPAPAAGPAAPPRQAPPGPAVGAAARLPAPFGPAVEAAATLPAPPPPPAVRAPSQAAPVRAEDGGGGFAWMRVAAPQAAVSAELAEAGRLAVEAGADLLQTGFGVLESATVEQVRAVRRVLPSRHAGIGVIAGGAEDADAARHLLERAGADRVAVLDPTAVLRGVAAA